MSTLASSELAQLWVYLAESPLLGLTLTVWVYLGAVAVYRASGQHSLANPVALSITVLALLLYALGIPYQRYFDGAQFIHFLLGPATVALALPLWEQRHMLTRKAPAVLAGVLVGSAVATGSAWCLAQWLGASHTTVASLAPKSVTTPVAMAIAEQIGGLPSLTAALVVCTGVVGAIMAPWLLRSFVRECPDSVGVALGSVAHGIGTARALQWGSSSGAYAALAMGISAVASSVLLPLVWRLFA